MALKATIDETAAAFGGLHYAFNNVGVAQAGVPLTSLAMYDYDHQMNGS